MSDQSNKNEARGEAIKTVSDALKSFSDEVEGPEYTDYADILETAGKIMMPRCSVTVKIKLITLS